METAGFTEASAPASAAITVTVKNVGARSMVAAIKARMISFEVTGPDRTVSCPSWPPTHAIPRESYRELKPEAKTSFTLLLDEVCPDNVFTRPGLYSVKAGVWANENGDELGDKGLASILASPTAREKFASLNQLDLADVNMVADQLVADPSRIHRYLSEANAVTEELAGGLRPTIEAFRNARKVAIIEGRPP